MIEEIIFVVTFVIVVIILLTFILVTMEQYRKDRKLLNLEPNKLTKFIDRIRPPK